MPRAKKPRALSFILTEQEQASQLPLPLEPPPTPQVEPLVEPSIEPPPRVDEHDFDDDIWMPPNANGLDGMTKEQISSFTMRNFGRRLDTDKPKAFLLDKAKQLYRTGPR